MAYLGKMRRKSPVYAAANFVNLFLHNATNIDANSCFMRKIGEKAIKNLKTQLQVDKISAPNW